MALTRHNNNNGNDIYLTLSLTLLDLLLLLLQHPEGGASFKPRLSGNETG